MHYSSRIQQAIILATEVHAGQTRKGKDIPYITHPLTVGLILASAGADEDIVIAGILHDTIEDSPPENIVTKQMLRDKFGEKVADLVDAVTEQDKSLPWEERKQQALSHIYEMSYDALLLKSADILANLSDLVADLEYNGDTVWDRFNTSKQKKIEQQKKLAEALETVWAENLLLPEIQQHTEKLITLAHQTV